MRKGTELEMRVKGSVLLCYSKKMDLGTRNIKKYENT